MKWFTVKESKLTWVPISYTNKKGETKTKFKRIGVRIDMEDGSWWFYSFVHNTWTQHYPRTVKKDFAGRPVLEYGKPCLMPERKETYTPLTLYREWAKRKPELINALEGAKNSAGNSD
jgi:hypothetical protein